MDIHEESPFEIENDRDINEHESYFINTSLSPCSNEKSLDSIDLYNIITHEISNPLMLSAPKNFGRVVGDVYVNHKYYRSHCVKS